MRFRLGTIPVRVHASFFVMAVVLASTFPTTASDGHAGHAEPSPAGLLVVALIMGASVLAHELGHALTGVAFGLTPAIELYAMGGLTSWARSARLSNGRRVLISLAGPGVGLVLCALAQAAIVAGVAPRGTLGKVALNAAFLVNGLWSVFNLLPILPLDGGHVVLHALNGLTGDHGEKPARVISLVAAIGVGLAALAINSWWVMILAASYAMQNGMALGRAKRFEQEAPLRRALEKAAADLQRGEARDAIAGAEAVAREAQDPELRIEALRVLAYGFVTDGRWSQLMNLLEAGLGRAIPDDDLARFEHAARASGSREVGDAIATLRAARAHPHVSS